MVGTLKFTVYKKESGYITGEKVSENMGEITADDLLASETKTAFINDLKAFGTSLATILDAEINFVESKVDFSIPLQES